MCKVRFFKTIQEATKNNNYNGIIETIFVADITKEKVEKLISEEMIGRFNVKYIKSLIPNGELFTSSEIVGNANDISLLDVNNCEYVFKILPKNVYNFFDNFDESLLTYCTN